MTTLTIKQETKITRPQPLKTNSATYFYNEKILKKMEEERSNAVEMAT
ncbi:hypothetical protein KAR91_79445 [Candidatus Pacearchaeota archaeon]|nr:hypothetical protein [Candidatus Pacearchaeota archaeon]